MDPETAPSTPLIQPKTPLPGKLIILGCLAIVAIIFFSLNYFKIIKSKTTPAPAPQIPPERTIKESESPVAFSVLQNPIVYEWRGSVSGTLTAKTDTSITLTDKGNSITISVDPNPGGTQFLQKDPVKKDQGISIALKDIPIGSKLRGDFWVFPHSKDKGIGSSFFVEQ